MTTAAVPETPGHTAVPLVASGGLRNFSIIRQGSERPVDRVLRRERARNLLSSDAGRSRSGLPRPPLRLRSGLRQNRISSAGSVLTLPWV